MILNVALISLITVVLVLVTTDPISHGRLSEASSS
jgi:hypothetical protein